MPFRTVNEVPLRELIAMADGVLEDTITDMDFLETLALHRCLLVPPFVMRASSVGGLTRITPLVYDADGEIDKAAVLVAMARKLRQLQGMRFGGRFRM